MKKYFLSLLFVSIALGSCNGQTAKNVIVMAPLAFQKKLKETKKAQLIDVRTPEEYVFGYINNAKNINWNDVDFSTKISTFDKNKPIFVYCKAGGRSGKATARLSDLGFKKIYDLEGGMTNWISSNLPIKK